MNIEFLNLNKHIKSIVSGKFASTNKELLLLASANTLLAYDIANNSEKFNIDISDGISCVSFGLMQGINKPLAIVGGNCSI